MEQAKKLKVAIAGYGQEGEASYIYWKQLGAEIEIFDEVAPSRKVPESIKTHFEVGAFSHMQNFDLIIRTPSLNPVKIKSESKIWSATNEFFNKCPAPIVGVTGTKGKGTTASLIAEILRADGKTIHLVGNIGTPALSELSTIKSEDIVVFELSSFQLWDLQKSPQVAVVLMIEPDHLDVHSSLEEYVFAKSHIAFYQTGEDCIIYHPQNSISAKIAAHSPAKKIRYKSPEGAHIVGDSIAIDGKSICSISEVGLLGEHNHENICAAVTAAWQFTNNVAAIKSAITSFKGLPHRLQIVAKVNKITYVDDSYSSAPGATIAAIASFTQPEVLICGGYSRDLDFTQLAQKISEQQNIKKVVLIGQTKQKIARALEEQNFTNFIISDAKGMHEIVAAASQIASEGDVVLLSPGCPSFDMFKNFEDRGQQFQQIVKGLY